MKSIELLSDTHGFIHPRLFPFFGKVDEIWYAGDFGSIETADSLAAFNHLKAVFGSIDKKDIRDLDLWEMKKMKSFYSSYISFQSRLNSL